MKQDTEVREGIKRKEWRDKEIQRDIRCKYGEKGRNKRIRGEKHSNNGRIKERKAKGSVNRRRKDSKEERISKKI